MTRQQKMAWYNLAVFGVAVLAYLGLWPVLGPVPALGAVGVCGLWGLSPLFFRKPRGAVVVDERDQLISLRAQVAGLWIFWECFVAAVMLTWGISRWYDCQTISIDALPWLVFGGMIIYVVTHSIAVLAQYGRSGDHESA